MMLFRLTVAFSIATVCTCYSTTEGVPSPTEAQSTVAQESITDQPNTTGSGIYSSVEPGNDTLTTTGSTASDARDSTGAASTNYTLITTVAVSTTPLTTAATGKITATTGSTANITMTTANGFKTTHNFMMTAAVLAMSFVLSSLLHVTAL